MIFFLREGASFASQSGASMLDALGPEALACNVLKAAHHGRENWLQRGRGRRRTATSWRRTRISASFDAWPRLSRSSQLKTRMMVRYRSRIGTDRDLASSRSAGQTAPMVTAHIEFWSGTRSLLAISWPHFIRRRLRPQASSS
jgi:hypothetical protein